MSLFYPPIFSLTLSILTYNDELPTQIHMIQLRLLPSNFCSMTVPPRSNQIFLIELLITLTVNPSSFIMINAMSLRIFLSNAKSLHAIMMHQPPHPGELETYNALCAHYWWPGMRTFVKNYVKGCAYCQQFKINHYPTRLALLPILGPTSTRPFAHLSMDRECHGQPAPVKTHTRMQGYGFPAGNPEGLLYYL
jgi:hypothetical protein